MADVEVTASTSGFLNAWIDFNADGDFLDAGEHIFVDTQLTAGTNYLNFVVPSDAVDGTTFSRFRFSTYDGLSYEDLAPDGEVEDYMVQISQSYLTRPIAPACYTKWGQYPELYDPIFTTLFEGWNEVSEWQYGPMIADEFLCVDSRPITGFRWWCSFRGWTQPYLPSILPDGFHIGIWSDAPVGGSDNPEGFGHPKTLIWETYCDCTTWKLTGYSIDPRDTSSQETLFEFTQLLSQDEWFYQQYNSGAQSDLNTYWSSITAVYDPAGPEPQYVWGWQTRPKFFVSGAVRIQSILQGGTTSTWPPMVGDRWYTGEPITNQGDPKDMVFELITDQPVQEQGDPDSGGDDL